MSVSDAQIIALLQAGKRQGMNALFDRYYKPLVVFADDLLHDLPEAEDTVLEQFVKLWEKRTLRTYPSNALSTFLFTIVKNACMNQIAKKDYPQAIRFTSLRHSSRGILSTGWNRHRNHFGCRPETSWKDTTSRQSVMCPRTLLSRKTADELEVSINTVKTLLKAGIERITIKIRRIQENVLAFSCYTPRIFNKKTFFNTLFIRYISKYFIFFLISFTRRTKNLFN